MKFLEREPQRRVDPKRVFPSAQTVIAAATAYRPHKDAPPSEYRIARFARGPDYHFVVREMLEVLLSALRKEGFDGRAFVDTGPLLERGLAAGAGLGWAGKNTCLIAPELGSYFVIGIILTDLAVEPDPILESLCRDCEKCLQACPTGALTAPFKLDARLCLSYHTVENRSSVPSKIRESVKDTFFGCDKCQEACPHNEDTGWTTQGAFKSPFQAPLLKEILIMEEREFSSRYAKTSLSRPGRAGLVRNAALVAGSLKIEEHKPLLFRLTKDPDEVVREHALWAWKRLDSRR